MEEYKLLIDNIRELVVLNEEDIPSIIKAFKPRHLKKKETLLFKGQVSIHMRFISKGCLRTYYIDEKGMEHILQFGIEQWWVNDLYSYLTQKPSKNFIQAVEESVVLQIHKESLEKLFKDVPSIERFFRLRIQSGYVALQERTIDSMSQTAEQRYQEFLSKYRHIEQRVPQYMVASYLGITPEFLSNIRKKISS